MSKSIKPGDKCITGYHGTSLTEAKQVLKEGFAPDKEIQFFPIDSTRTVRMIGRFAAIEAGDAEYVLIEAQFPEVLVTEGIEDDYVMIPSDAIKDIEIKSVTAWQMRANAGIPPRQLYPFIAADFAERWQ